MFVQCPHLNTILRQYFSPAPLLLFISTVQAITKQSNYFYKSLVSNGFVRSILAHDRIYLVAFGRGRTIPCDQSLYVLSTGKQAAETEKGFFL